MMEGKASRFGWNGREAPPMDPNFKPVVSYKKCPGCGKDDFKFLDLEIECSSCGTRFYPDVPGKPAEIVPGVLYHGTDATSYDGIRSCGLRRDLNPYGRVYLSSAPEKWCWFRRHCYKVNTSELQLFHDPAGWPGLDYYCEVSIPPSDLELVSFVAMHHPTTAEHRFLV